MRSKSRPREADFRSFFDLIVGVVFIFLILLSAQMFFLHGEDTEKSDIVEKQKRSFERLSQIKSFLDQVERELRNRNIDASIDLTRTELRLPLDQLQEASSGPAPQFTRARSEALGQVLLLNVKCLQDGKISDVCLDWNLLKLNDVQINVQTGKPPPNLELPADRFGQLVATVFSSTLLSAQPQLLSLTTSAGLPVFQFGSLPSDLESRNVYSLLRIQFRFGE
jgi:hypothetical protein